MKTVHLQHLSKDGKLIEALFTPSHGMNLLSFKKDGQEFIDQNTRKEFEKRCGGLGPLIGPHFYHRKEGKIPIIREDLFPHLNKMDIESGKEPLSHGVGRYAPWNYDETSSSITGHLSGIDTIKDVTLASIEGFNFHLDFTCHLTDTGLDIHYKVKSEKEPSTIGLHYYLSLPEKKGFVSIPCRRKYNDLGDWKDIPSNWKDEKGDLSFNLQEAADYGFLPKNEKFEGCATLITPSHKLKICYKATTEQNAFQLYSPKDASFVCIEPVSAKDPRSPEGADHNLKITIDIL